MPAAAGRTVELVDEAPDVTPPATTPTTHARTTPARPRRPTRLLAADRGPLLLMASLPLSGFRDAPMLALTRSESRATCEAAASRRYAAFGEGRCVSCTRCSPLAGRPAGERALPGDGRARLHRRLGGARAGR